MDDEQESDMLKALKQLREIAQEPQYKYFLNADDRKDLFERIKDPRYATFIQQNTIGSKFMERGKVARIEESKLRPSVKVEREVTDEAFKAVGDAISKKLYGTFLNGAYRATYTWPTTYFETVQKVIEKINPNWSDVWDNWRNTGEYQWKWVGRLVAWIKAKFQR